MTLKLPELGPLRAEDIRPGERYELVNGHRVYRAPAGGTHSKPNLLGGVRSLCRVLSIALTAERETALARMNAAELDTLRARIECDRCWD